MRYGYLNSAMVAVACMAMLCASAFAADTTQQRMRKTTPMKTAPAQMQKIAPAVQRPPELDTRPDLTLGACQIECSRGGPHSTQICQQYGYSDQFTFRVKAVMRNSGKGAASIESGWREWSATHSVGGGAANPVGSAQTQGAPAGGIYLVPDAVVPGINSPIVYNLHNLAPGTHRVVFTADPENHVSEKDETNNTSQCEWTVEAGSATAPFDLTITHVSVSPQSGPPGTRFHFEIIVKNVGGPTFDGFNASCEPGTGFNRPELDAGESYSRTFEIPGTLTPGQKTINCQVHGFQPEQNTSNNTMTATFTVTQPNY